MQTHRPDAPRQSSSRRIVLLVVVLAAGVLFVTRVLPLLIVLVPKSTGPAQQLEDTNDLRQIAGLVVMSRTEVPLASDGRIDVYALLTGETGRVDRKRIVDICHSSRARKGPTWEEIQAGDYRNFPYQRYRGALDRKSYVRVPVVWDRSPKEGRRLAGFSDGSAVSGEEATFQEFFRSNPGQE